jgi:SAM-dependent methyltransferase
VFKLNYPKWQVLNVMSKRKKCAPVNSADVLQRFPIRKSELDRFKSGKRQYYDLLFLNKQPFPSCLDVACGAKPFPKANVLCDLNAKPVPDRRMKCLVTEEKPFVLCDSRYLPFKDKAFDFVTSYYLLEHVPAPWLVFRELKRVSKHGYIQCPTWFNEILYGEDVHHWIVLKRKDKLYLKKIDNGKLQVHLGFIFHRLYQSSLWQIIHAILDETFHMFSVCYSY